MSTREFFRRNLGPWAGRLLARLTTGLGLIVESFVAGQAPDDAVAAEEN